jgi:surface antigen
MFAETKPKLGLKLGAAALAALLLGACNNTGPKEGMGTILGTAGGGLLGAQFGRGETQLAATAAGVFLGGLIGNQVGKSLDEADRHAIQEAHYEAREAPLNEPIHWNNPDSGHRGTVTPIREGRTRTGAYCREFQTTVFVGGEAQEGYGTACRQPDGSWRIVNG